MRRSWVVRWRLAALALLAAGAIGCRGGDSAVAEASGAGREGGAQARPEPGPDAAPAPVADSRREAPPAQAALKVVVATFTSPLGQRSAFRLDVADTPALRETGLMFRKDLAPDRGMLFVFPVSQDQAFYMKNTYVPLDMVFVGADRKVVGVVPDARPLTLDIRSVGRPSRYVIELNSHTAARRGIAQGATVVFDPPVKD